MTQIPLATLLSCWTPSLGVFAGLLVYTVLAIAAIAWLTAPVAARRPKAVSSGRSRIVDTLCGNVQ